MNTEKNDNISKRIQRSLGDPDSTNFLIDRACNPDQDSRDFLMRLCEEISKVTDIPTRDRIKGILINRVYGNEVLRENLVSVSEKLKSLNTHIADPTDTEINNFSKHSLTLHIVQDVLDRVERIEEQSGYKI